MTSPSVRLARRIYFSCGHRYYSPQLSEAENKKIFGACYTEYGHGHNYTLEAYIEGAIDPVTGMIINLSEVDEVLKAVTAPLDHHHLNFDVPHFKDHVPTTENIAAYLYKQIEGRLHGRALKLHKIRLYEYEDLWVDYGAPTLKWEE